MTRWVWGIAALALILTGATILLVPYLSDPVEAALAGVDRDQAEEVVFQTGRAAERLEKWSVARLLVADAESRLQAAQLWLLYRQEQYDELLNRTIDASDDARPHFWRASAQFQKGIRSEDKETALTWLRQSEEQFLESLRLFPDDWDTKFNYELVHRLIKSLEDPQEAAPVRVLRPRPQQGKTPPSRKG